MKRYYAIYSNFATQEFANFATAKQTEPMAIVKIEKTGEHVSKSGTKYDLNTITFLVRPESILNENTPNATIVSVAVFKIRNWAITQIGEASFGQYANYGPRGYAFNGGIVEYLIKDPKGKVVGLKFPDNIEGVVLALKKLFEISVFESWQNYQLMKDNEKLKTKIEELEHELVELKKK